MGTLSSGGSPATKLRQVRVITLANDDWRCINASYDKQRQFCAMVDGGGKDSCQGDSGGPIHQWLDDHWEQVGIVSFGTGCALPTNPGIYTRLSFYHDWIQATINGIDQTTITSSPSASLAASSSSPSASPTTSSSSPSASPAASSSSTSASPTTSVSATSTSRTTTDVVTNGPNNSAITIESKVFLVLMICILVNFLLIN